MLTEEQIINNKNEFLELVNRLAVARPEYNDWEGLINYLNTSDFFSAPASTMFHGAYVGGLCEHSLNVYKSIIDLATMYQNTHENVNFTWENLALTSLFHDLSKINFYEKSIRNVKRYWDGNPETLNKYNKKDDNGYFNWFTEESFIKKSFNDTFIYGNHEETSVFKLQEFIALSTDEIVAILHHTGYITSDGDFNKSKEYSYVFSSYPLALLLHLADTYATFAIESTGELR